MNKLNVNPKPIVGENGRYLKLTTWNFTEWHGSLISSAYNPMLFTSEIFKYVQSNTIKTDN